MQPHNNCPFCNGSVQDRCVYQSRLAFVLYPLAPAVRCHVLIIPRRHVNCIDSLTDAEVLEMHRTLQTIVTIGKNHIEDFVGYNLLSNNGGPAVNQRVPHCHIHVFLRSKADRNPLLTGRHAGAVHLSEPERMNMAALRKWLKEVSPSAKIPNS